MLLCVNKLWSRLQQKKAVVAAAAEATGTPARKPIYVSCVNLASQSAYIIYLDYLMESTRARVIILGMATCLA